MPRKLKTNRHKQTLLAALAAVAGFAGVVFENGVIGQSNQDQIELGAVYDCGTGLRKFKVVSCEGNDDFDNCKVQTLREGMPNYEDKMYRRAIKGMIAEGCKIKSRPKQTNNESAPNETGTNTEARTETGGTGKTGKFKPGDRVMASPGMMNEDKYYQPCTVISAVKPNSYWLLCDPHNGISFRDTTVREDFVRAWSNATPAPKIECPLEEPPGTVTKTAPASAALFKRMIYEKEAASHHNYKVGVKFETFQMGQPYKNVWSGRKLLHDFLPQGTTVYPVKTRYATCVQARPDDQYSRRTVWETCYSCAKDKFGEWTCGPGCGAKNPLEQHNVPNLSYFFKER
jgi:hypothetical protein